MTVHTFVCGYFTLILNLERLDGFSINSRGFSVRLYAVTPLSESRTSRNAFLLTTMDTLRTERVLDILAE